MILLRNVLLSRAGRPLIEELNLQINTGWKVGVTGANGCGKSSLFELLRDELHADKGDVEIPRTWSVAHVAQETPALPDIAIEFVLDGDVELRAIERALEDAETAHDGERIGTLHERLGNIGGYAARARAAELMHGLGFSDAAFDKPVATFSGGWRVRLNLAKALMCRSDLLLLDEPTNYLDLDAIVWMEGWLRNYPGTLLMVSHDRDFLDAIADHIAHIEARRLKLYTGGYSDFERQRAAHLALQQSMYEKQQREIAHLHAFVDRFRAKASKARQAQSRLKALARMEEVTAAHVDTPFTFHFFEPAGNPDPLLVLHEAAAGYNGTGVLRDIEVAVRKSDRIGILGRNGAGKSTLVKLLAGELPAAAGLRQAASGLAIGYFAQHQVDRLNADDSPIGHLNRIDRRAREQDLRNYLGQFDFRGDMAFAPVGPFSGGEKSRLALAMIIWQRPNLLLLDEPTNHLDLEMRHALTLALQEFEGAVVLVSHDRHLLRTTCERFVLVDGGRVAPFDGDLEDYRNWLSGRSSSKSPPDAPSPDRKGNRSRGRKDRQPAAGRPLENEREQLEGQLQEWQRERQLLEAQFSDPALYSPPDPVRLGELTRRRDEIARSIETAEARWLALSEQLDRPR